MHAREITALVVLAMALYVALALCWTSPHESAARRDASRRLRTTKDANRVVAATSVRRTWG
jgi:hypothetical protein